MNQITTITSKKQLTIPAEAFRQAGLSIGQRVIVTEENGSLKITPAEKLVEELAGSLEMPKRWKGKSIKWIKNHAIAEYFSHYKK